MHYCPLLRTKQALPGRHLGTHEAVGRAHGAVPGREHDEGETAVAHRAVLHHCNVQAWSPHCDTWEISSLQECLNIRGAMYRNRFEPGT